MNMLTQLVKVSLQNQCKRNFLARQPSLCNNLQNKLLQSNRKASSKNKTVDDENLDEPIKYSTSKAATWLAAETRSPMMDRHPQESNVIVISLSIFFIYFFILREENDLDLLLEKPLSETVPGIITPNTPDS
ncbi:PREDICTED: uncharacterized protein LOC107072072 [Polistes dominula]|uniref:Uncharacterized protein LOC107072072 n=1 Tax=Polistes dominula TaxID=743375 RepID=A0ABM1J3X3_POLDO|nr:PREDICTED: uncharacterized protein LOC107072072 [Polistes dominula]